jgi:hypothetical protein
MRLMTVFGVPLAGFMFVVVSFVRGSDMVRVLLSFLPLKLSLLPSPNLQISAIEGHDT